MSFLAYYLITGLVVWALAWIGYFGAKWPKPLKNVTVWNASKGLILGVAVWPVLIVCLSWYWQGTEHGWMEK